MLIDLSLLVKYPGSQWEKALWYAYSYTIKPLLYPIFIIFGQRNGSILDKTEVANVAFPTNFVMTDTKLVILSLGISNNWCFNEYQITCSFDR